jgi:DNA polymerase-3 subunit alpha
VNKRVLESLIKSGACDSFKEARSGIMENLQVTMEMAQANQRDRQLGQSSMFGVFEEQEVNDKMDQKTVEEWGEQERLKNEKESIGFYITGHPLDGYTQDLAWFTDANSASISEAGHKKKVSLAGIPGKVLIKTTRKGNKMAIVTLEDLHGSVEVILWPEIFSASEDLLASEEPVLIKGEVDAEGSLPKVLADEIHPLSEAKNHWIGKVHIHLRTPGLEKETLLQIKNILSAHKGSNETFLHFNFPDNNVRTIRVDAGLRVQPSDEVVRDIEAILGEEAILFE